MLPRTIVHEAMKQLGLGTYGNASMNELGTNSA